MEVAKVAKLNNSNYADWSFSVKALLRREKLWKYVDPGQRPAQAPEAWDEGDEKATATIQLLVEASQYNLIRQKTTAKATWDALEEHHNKASLGQKVTLLKYITNQNYKVGESMEEFLNDIERVYRRLANSGLEMSECLKVALILRGLPDSFNPLTTALEARDEEELTLAMVRVKLIDEADKQNKKINSSEEQALRVGSQNPDGCFQCGKPGHRKRNCKEFLELKKKGLISDDKKKSKKASGKAKIVRGDDPESFTFMVRSNEIGTGAWLIDSGATSHLANDKSAFVRLDKSVRPVISGADGNKLRTEGIGDCTVQCVDDRGEKVSITLTDVIYAPGLESNLVSVAKLSNKGVRAEFDGQACKLVYGQRVVAIGNRVGGLYQLRLAGERSLLVNGGKGHTEECQHTWHRKLGHRNPDAVKDVKHKALVTGMSVNDCGIRSTCECCIKAKMARPPFPQVAEKTSKEVLDIVHSDVCGPFIETPGGSKYYMTMIDDHSRYTMVYFLNAKSEVEERIRDYVRFTQNQLGKKPKAIRSDRGGEYSSNSLRKFYAQEGTRAEYTTGYAPQQNAKRKNRTLDEMGLCMLLDAELPRRIWAEAVNTAAYIQNRLPSTAVDGTPFEIWFGRKPSLADMKVFGCAAYVWIPPQKRKKFDVKAEKLTFVGYSSEHKAYRFLDVNTGKIVVSRDVRFLKDGKAHTKGGSTSEGLGDAVQDDGDEISVRLDELLEDDPADPEVNPDSDEEEYGFADAMDFLGFHDEPVENVPVQEEPAEEELVQEELVQEEPEENREEQVRRSTRSNIGVPPERFRESIGLAAAVIEEPMSYAEAMASPESDRWSRTLGFEKGHRVRWNVLDFDQLQEDTFHNNLASLH